MVRRRGISPRDAGLFVLHLVAAFIAGVIALAVVALIVTRVTDGDTAFLETRGLPAFIGVAVSVGVFALLRDRSVIGSRATMGGRIAAAVGLIALVVVGASLYRPPVLAEPQRSVERVLGIWSGRDTEAVEDFQADLTTWNAVLARNQRGFVSLIRGGGTVDQFQTTASNAQEELERTISSMESHAAAAGNPELRDALDDLAGIYEDQLGGIRAASRGLIENDIPVIENGDATFKRARERANELFTERLQPLLERADIETDAFESLLNTPPPQVPRATPAPAATATPDPAQGLDP